MNRLIRMLQLMVCLYLGFASFAARAGSLDDVMDARDIAMGNISAAEVQVRKVARETQSTLIEKTFACDPVFIVTLARWHRFFNESFEESVSKPYKEMLKFRGCQDQDVSEEMRKAFLKKYVSFYLQRTEDKTRAYPFAYDEAKQKYEESEWEPSDISVSRTFEIDKKEKAERDSKQKEERKRAEEEAAQKEAIKMHIEGLKSGAISVSSFKDAALLHEPKNLAEVMNSPLLRPDNALYAAAVAIDEEEGELLLVKIGGGRNMFGGWVNVAYAALRLTKKTKNYSQNGMRIGGRIKVIGRYVQNKKYKTLAGEGKTMPVLEVMYIDDQL